MIAYLPPTPQPVPIPRADAVMVAEAVISGAAWESGTGRWEVDWCSRASQINWLCSTRVALQESNGSWTLCVVKVRVFLRTKRDPGVEGWPRWKVTRVTCASPTNRPAVKEA